MRDPRPFRSLDVAHHGAFDASAYLVSTAHPEGEGFLSLSVSAPGRSCGASHLSPSDPACSVSCGDVTPVLVMTLPGPAARAVGAEPLTHLGRLSVAAHARSQGAPPCGPTTQPAGACFACAEKELERPSRVALDQ